MILFAGSMSFLDKLMTGVVIFAIQSQSPSSEDQEDHEAESARYYPKVIVRFCGALALTGLLATASLMKSHVGVFNAR